MDNIVNPLDLFTLSDIKKNLKRFSFPSKMEVTQIYSEKILGLKGLEYLDEKTLIMPWELEMFTSLSILTNDEYEFNDFKDRKEIRKFSKIINSIKNYLENEEEAFLHPDRYLRMLKSQQIAYQHEFIFDFYRYFFLFNYSDEKTNIKELFEAKYTCQYNDFILFGYCVLLVFNACKTTGDDRQILRMVFNKFKHIIVQLRISRKDIIQKAKDIKDISYEKSIGKLILQYAIIYESENDFYIPIPHAIPYALTHGLMYRLTSGDDNARSLIGKSAMEKYLYKIIYDTKNYDEIHDECKYVINGSDAYLPDIIVSKNETLIFFEMKSSVPSIKSNSLVFTDYEKELKRIARNANQICKQIKNFLNELYNPIESGKFFLVKNIFGVLVLQEEYYFQRSEILPYIADENKELFEKNIFITDLLSIERIVFYQQDLIEIVKKNGECLGEEFNHIAIIENESKYKYSDQIMEFKTETVDKAVEFIKSIVSDVI